MKIKKKYAKLLVESKSIKNIDWLKETMCKHDRPYLSEKDFDEFDLGKQNFLTKNTNSLVVTAQREWKVIKANEPNTTNPDMRCELCGRKDLQLISYIQRKDNPSKVLKVGSSCINDFIFIANNSKKDREITRKEKKELENKLYIESKITGIQEKIDFFEKIINNPRYFLNKELYEESEEIKSEVQKKYYNQIKRLTQKTISIYSIKELLEKVEKFSKKIEVQYKLCNTKEWGLNKNIAKWVNKNADENLIKILRLTNKITPNISFKIEEPKYLKMQAEKIRPYLRNLEIEIKKIDSTNNKAEITFKRFNYFVLNVKITDLIFLFKENIFNVKTNYDIDDGDIFRKSKIPNKSLSSALGFFVRRVGKSEWINDYLIDNEFSFENIIYFVGPQNQIYKLDYYNFINHFKDVVYQGKPTQKNTKEIIEYISKNKQLTRSEYEKELEIIYEKNKGSNVEFI